MEPNLGTTNVLRGIMAAVSVLEALFLIGAGIAGGVRGNHDAVAQTAGGPGDPVLAGRQRAGVPGARGARRLGGVGPDLT